MIKIGIEKGLCNKETVKCSQELDELLNQYRRVYYLAPSERKGVLHIYIA
ncbi:aspartyl-phosphate phosphatase Spo0E family protein [bacterium LRH843]|nr:aspartyl-phosphate phosphatase Spo0E family protein [bacterium LRH843]